jgi:hypothetical protein
MEYSEVPGRRPRITGSASARLVSRKWACPECADTYGCRAGSRQCEGGSPPRNPMSRLPDSVEW